MAADSRLLTEGQRKLVGFALALLALLATIALLGLVIWVLGGLVGRFAGVLWPLAVAGILALILRPIVDWLEGKMKLHRLAAVILLFGSFLILAGGLALLIVPPLARQVLDFISYLPALWERALAYLEQSYPAWKEVGNRYLNNPTVHSLLQSLLNDFNSLASHALPSLRAAGAGVLTAVSFVTSFAVIPIYLFFFLLSRSAPADRLAEHLSFLNPGVRADVVFLVREFIGIVVAFFRGQFLIGLIMGILLAIGFTAVGLRFGLFIGLAIGVLNIVPYLGTILGLSVALPLAFFEQDGGWLTVGLVLLVFVLVQATEGWFLTPRIMGRRTGLHPAVIIFAVFFWGTALGGLLGMILAVPLTAFFVTAWRLVKQKCFRPA